MKKIAAWSRIALLSAGALMLWVSPLPAAIVAYDNFSGVLSGGLQAWRGNLGLDFTVNSSITVTQLGAFNNGIKALLDGSDGLSGVDVQIYAIGGVYPPGAGTPVGPTVHFTSTMSSGSQVNGDWMVDVSPFVLAPGLYSVVTWNDYNYNSGFTGVTQTTLNDGGGALDFGVPTAQSRYDGNPSLDFPDSTNGGVSNYTPVPRFNAGTFAFVIPEPHSSVAWSLMGLAFGGAGYWRKRRRLPAS